MCIRDRAKAEVAKLYDKHTIIDLMPTGSDEIRFEYQMNRGGDVKWEDINLICVQRDAAGMPTRLLYTTQDVTALKQREKQLQLAMEDSYRCLLYTSRSARASRPASPREDHGAWAARAPRERTGRRR